MTRTAAAGSEIESKIALDTFSMLLSKIESRTAVIGIVGLGYVGLPLVKAVHDAGFPVIGFDVDRNKIEKLKRGESYLKHLGDDLTSALADSDRFTPTADETDLAQADAIILCVPTPLGRHREPDLSFVLKSTELVARVIRRGQLVVLESTTYPGTTRDEMRPILEQGGLRCGVDFFLAYSPEREDPGRVGMTTSKIPKLVGGVDEHSTRLAMAFYTRVIEHVHQVDSAEIAEAAKLLENIYRAVNIALVNELKVIFDRLGIDVWKVIEAAATKPFGFQAFYPGPGLGGHCIPIDPFYLTWKAKETGYATKFIELAGEINSQMPSFVVAKVAEALNRDAKPVRGSHILILGIAYKPNVDDVRESPAAEIIEQLVHHGAHIRYHDPHVPTFPEMRRHQIDLQSVPLTPEELRKTDCVLIVTDHDGVDYEMVGREARLVVDTRNAMAGVANPRAAIIKA
ncbi:MAG: nucleotide sugar dehydrogenase [Planctomycetota bacterium]|nr:MAG: nucleotide sugar dehydrogenase [Planctomycetota bacterium]